MGFLWDLVLGAWGFYRFRHFPRLLVVLAFVLAPTPALPADPVPDRTSRLRFIIETDAGGDPDDEQSLVRFLLYANEWDIEGIIANRARTRDRENLNPERTGLGVVRRLVDAYGQCYPNLARHDRRYPTRQYLWQRTVPGYDDTEEAVRLIITALDRPDPRPLWYSDWGSDNGAGTNNLKRALDQLWRERGPERYAQAKRRLRLVSYDKFDEHTTALAPLFTLWVNTFQPEIDRRRWYHRFSALTSTAGGFDLVRDVLTGHGPLGAMYPTNTTHGQKEGDSMTFLYLVPTGMNSPTHPGWGSWAGRYGPNENFPGKPYFWANQRDAWQGSVHRDHTLARWAAHLQNDFRARLDWCVRDFRQANHPPVVQVRGTSQRNVRAGKSVLLDARGSHDRDGDALSYEWVYYPEPGTYRGDPPKIEQATSARATVILPVVATPETVHLILMVTDAGTPPLTRYARVVLHVQP